MKLLLICLVALLAVINAEYMGLRKATLKLQQNKRAIKSTALTVPEKKSTALTVPEKKSTALTVPEKKSTALTVPEKKSTALALYKPKTSPTQTPVSSNPTSNNGGPRDNNFGMINLIRTNSGWLKINDNDNNNNNNNNINIPVSINGVGNTIVLQLTLVNNNHNYNLN